MTVFPPENANEDSEADKNSGDENFADIKNLPGSQLRAEVEPEIKFLSVSENDWETDYEYLFLHLLKESRSW